MSADRPDRIIQVDTLERESSFRQALVSRYGRGTGLDAHTPSHPCAHAIA